MKITSIIVVAFVLFLSVDLAYADKVKMRGGDVLIGVLANRDSIIEAPLSQTHFSLLLSESSELLRISPDEIDYLVLEGEGDPIVIDLSSFIAVPNKSIVTPEVSSQPKSGQEIMTENSRGTSGVPLIVCGVVVAAVGVFVKFGDEEITLTADSIEYDEKTYNELNYALMVVGGSMFFGGLWMESDRANKARQENALSGEIMGRSVAYAPSVGLRIRF